MIADSERREVAARLRGCAFTIDNSILPVTLEAKLSDIVCGHGSADADELLYALADLIEQDTTTDTTKSPADTTKCDRDALIELADEIDGNDVTYCISTQYVLDSYARRIREALGVES